MREMGQLQNYSDGYYILDADVVEWGGDRAILPTDLEKYLEKYVRRPIFRIGNAHFVGYSEHGVPADTIAFPKGTLPEGGDGILVAKNDTAIDLIYRDEVEDWRG